MRPRNLYMIKIESQNKKSYLLLKTAFLYLNIYYLGCGESTGQTLAQAPQSIHADSSITYTESPAEIQLTGHSASQAPQEIHDSLMK